MRNKNSSESKPAPVPARCRSLTRETQMPSAASALRSAVVLEARGPYAIALSDGHGTYLGLHRREESK